MRRDLHALAERMARVEDALTGPLVPNQRLAGAGIQDAPGDRRRVTCHFR